MDNMNNLNHLYYLISEQSPDIITNNRNTTLDLLFRSWESLKNNKDFLKILEYAFTVYQPNILYENAKYSESRKVNDIPDTPDLRGFEVFIEHLKNIK